MFFLSRHDNTKFCDSTRANLTSNCRRCKCSTFLAICSAYSAYHRRHSTLPREQGIYCALQLIETTCPLTIHLRLRYCLQSSSTYWHKGPVVSRICRDASQNKRTYCCRPPYPIFRQIVAWLSFHHRLFCCVVIWCIASSRTTRHILLELACRKLTFWLHRPWYGLWHTF